MLKAIFFLSDQLPTRVNKIKDNEFYAVNILTTRPVKQAIVTCFKLIMRHHVKYFDCYGIRPHQYSLLFQKFINSYQSKCFVHVAL